MNLEARFRVPAKGLRLSGHDPGDRAGLDKDASAEQRERDVAQLGELQERLYAEGRQALLVIFQAMDAAGKDGTIAHVMTGVNPQGVRVTSFKQPSSLELSHDWLWRCAAALPAHGEIGIFNRSHYEEVLVVRVHPEYLGGQGIDPARGAKDAFWRRRLEAIAAWERHLGDSGTRVVKFFLNVSREEQRARFLARTEEEAKHWKFSAADVRERAHWKAYQAAYADALAATSTDEAPWYVIPADHKWLMRTAVASILVHHLREMNPQFPVPSNEERTAMDAAVTELQAEDR